MIHHPDFLFAEMVFHPACLGIYAIQVAVACPHPQVAVARLEHHPDVGTQQMGHEKTEVVFGEAHLIQTGGD